MYAKMTIVMMSDCTKCLVQNWQILLKKKNPDKDYTQIMELLRD